jgi:hypothetical protein
MSLKNEAERLGASDTKRTELRNQDTIKECIERIAPQNIAARSREYLQYRASKYMGFLKCIKLARQNIAAQSREYLQYCASKYTGRGSKYTVKSEVCRWENADKLGGHFVYVGDTAPRHVLFEGDLSESEEEGMHCMQCRHGYGICIWDEAGARYEGCWYCDGRSGLGLMIYPDGTVVEGQWAGGDLRHNQATLWLRDGARCFEGYWQSIGIPFNGSMMEANGDVYYAENSDHDCVRLFYMEKGEDSSESEDTSDSSESEDTHGDRILDGSIDGETAWASAVRAMTDKDSPQFSSLDRELMGRVVVGGAPVPGGAGVVRAVHIELADGGTYVGPMCGLAYFSVGVMTDALGGAWRVKNKRCDWDDQSRKTSEKFLNGDWCNPDDKEVPSP